MPDRVHARMVIGSRQTSAGPPKANDAPHSILVIVIRKLIETARAANEQHRTLTVDDLLTVDDRQTVTAGHDSIILPAVRPHMLEAIAMRLVMNAVALDRRKATLEARVIRKPVRILPVDHMVPVRRDCAVHAHPSASMHPILLAETAIGKRPNIGAPMVAPVR